MWKYCILATAVAFIDLGLSPVMAGETASEVRSRASRQGPAFKTALLRLRFRKPDEAARFAELSKAAQHLDHPELPAVLAESIEVNLNRGQVTRSVIEAARLFCQLDRASLKDEQLALLTHQQANVSLTAVGVSELAQRRVPEAFDIVLQLAKRPEFSQSFGMRRTVVDSAAQYATPAAVEFLTAVLTEHDGMLRYETARHLTRLTKQNFGGYPQHWQEWWTANKASFEFDSEISKRPVETQDDGSVEAMPWPQPVPKFFGQPIYGKRVLFVIDRSRSMLSSVDGVTRNEEVQEELEGVIDDLPEGTFFNLIAYEEERQPWATELVESTFEARSAAIRFVYSLLPQNKTALYDALEEALRHDENTEQIVLLSDGKPTAGRVVIPGAIVELITRQNVFSQTTIDAVGIDTRGDEEQFLEQLTSRNFGTLRVIR